MRYLAITAKVKNANNYVGWFADDIAAVATAKTRAGVKAKLPDLLAVHVANNPDSAPVIQALEEVPVEELEGSIEIQTVWVEPSQTDPIGVEIERALKEAGVTQAELGKRLGASQGVVSRWINSSGRSIQLDTLQRIADALGMRLEPPRFVKGKNA